MTGDGPNTLIKTHRLAIKTHRLAIKTHRLAIKTHRLALNRRHHLPAVLLATLMLITGPAFACDAQPPEDDRLTDSASQSPCNFQSAAVIDARDLKALIDAGGQPVLIDVAPIRNAGETKINGYWVVSDAHENIAGSLWLPNVGHGALDEEMAAYFRTNLDRATAGNQNRLLVVYGVAGRWMSWNAAKRAHELGYERVAWLADGVEGWRQAGEPTALAAPEPIFRDKRIDQASLNR